MGFRFTIRAGHPTFVDLPWEHPLVDWTLVSPARPTTGASGAGHGEEESPP